MSDTQYAGSFTMTMASAASNIDFFRGTLSDDACANWRVTINDTVSEQKANNLTFSANDVIKIEYDTNECIFHPGESRSTLVYNRIYSITGSLPIYPISMGNSTVTSELVFSGCTNLQEISENLFENWSNVTNFDFCFSSCKNLVSIPENLFSNNVKVVSFRSCFYNCTNLTSIPGNLFSNNIEVTTFYSCFSNCTNLSIIPFNLFANNNLVTDFRECFYNCTNLTSIPENLFSSNSLVTSFYQCFSKCSSLTSLPNNLFSNNTLVTDFQGCFAYCTNLTSISENLFSNNTKVDLFTRCFQECTGLTTVPENLFINNVLVTGFYACFEDCSNLTTVPSNIFINNTMVEGFSDCFRNCSKLVPTIYISSPIVKSVDYFASGCASIGTVYVLANSITYETFIWISNEYPDMVNVNVLTWNPDAIEVSDTPLVSMVLVDDNNNRTTFNGPIINDFTITEDLQDKITQLTTLATNISNLQTRLTNITNILNTQNIEFTDNISDVSSAGSKLYIQPQVYLKLIKSGNTVRYLNLTTYINGKHEFTSGVSLDVTCSLGIESNFDSSEWNATLGPNSIEGLTLNVGGTTEAVGSINMNGVTIYQNGIVDSSPATIGNNSIITITSVSGSVGTINIKFTK